MELFTNHPFIPSYFKNTFFKRDFEGAMVAKNKL
uniref:Uncharacterized protein n=1 Tax=Uncultured archaeon GZfos26G2 TaxID=3386331 RepID=Q648L4_UNCAG|nr:hypothetical protein GZ37D1_10 [uncultured archaeon GZfos37D1]